MSKVKFKHLFLSITLMISFEGLILAIYVWVFDTIAKDTMKKPNLKQHFATTFRRLTKKIGFNILEDFCGPLQHACT
jgi:hypothetical protein